MDIKKFEEKTVRSELIFDGKVVHLYRDDIELPDGRGAFREYVRHIGAVCVIPLTDDGDVVLEIPAGKLDYKGEDPEEAARRELREETGAVSGRLTYLGKFFSSPAILDECIHMFLAEELTFGENDLDDDEFIEVVRIPIEELADMICRGEVIDGKTQSGVMKALYILNNRKNRAQTEKE